MFEFSAAWVFFLLPLPLIIYRFIKPADDLTQHHIQGVVVPFYQQLTQEQYSVKKEKTKHLLWRVILLSLIWLLLVASAAKPQWVGAPQAINLSGRDLLLAVDISDSMNEEDMFINNRAVTRLSAVKQVVNEFIRERQGDRIGLVLFGSNAYLQTPLTFDTQSVEQFLQEAQLRFAGPSTAIGDAIGLSVKRLKDRGKNTLQTGDSNSKNNKVIILLTDGANTAGEVDPIQAAKLAATIDAKIYTIGIGAEEMVVRGLFGNRRINPSASLDEDTLQTIADTTGGRYFRARNINELNQIYNELDSLEPITQDQEWLRPISSFFMWPLSAALAISILWILLTYYHSILLIIRSHLSQRAEHHG